MSLDLLGILYPLYNKAIERERDCSLLMADAGAFVLGFRFPVLKLVMWMGKRVWVKVPHGTLC